jgi:hypothetical protein
MSPLGYWSPFRTNDEPQLGPKQPGESGDPKTEAVGSGARKMRAQAAALNVKLPETK